MTSLIRQTLTNCDHLLKSAELAKLLSVTDVTINVWVTAGTIPYYKAGHVNRFDPLEILSWLEAKAHRLDEHQFKLWLEDRGILLSLEQVSRVWECLGGGEQ